jgi:hypothetical protein
MAAAAPAPAPAAAMAATAGLGDKTTRRQDDKTTADGSVNTKDDDNQTGRGGKPRVARQKRGTMPLTHFFTQQRCTVL